MTDLIRTKLYEEHVALKAKMVPFGGFDMPVQYTSVKDEVLAVRNNIGMFDVSHMGEFFVEGADAHKFVDYIMTNDFISADMNKAVYSPLCRENGTIVDDLIAYKIGAEKVLICVNASNIAKDWKHLNQYVSKFNCKLTNHSENYSLIAVQGPKTEEVLKSLELLPNTDIPYYAAFEHSYKTNSLILARTGYTGEDGFEIFCKNDFIVPLWKMLLSKNVTPCGLASRDVLRLEVCYPLYGHELNDEVTPLDSDLRWTVKLKKENFVSKEALASYTPKFQLLRLTIDKGIPREGYTVHTEDGKTVGTITSGSLSVVNNRGMAIARIEKNLFTGHDKLFINIRNKMYEAFPQKEAFVKGGHK